MHILSYKTYIAVRMWCSTYIRTSVDGKDYSQTHKKPYKCSLKSDSTYSGHRVFFLYIVVSVFSKERNL